MDFNLTLHVVLINLQYRLGSVNSSQAPSMHINVISISFGMIFIIIGHEYILGAEPEIGGQYIPG